MEDEGVLVRLPIRQEDLREDAADVFGSCVHEFDGAEVIGLSEGVCGAEFSEASALG